MGSLFDCLGFRIGCYVDIETTFSLESIAQEERASERLIGDEFLLWSVRGN